jgi:hypothetical protein
MAELRSPTSVPRKVDPESHFQNNGKIFKSSHTDVLYINYNFIAKAIANMTGEKT